MQITLMELRKDRPFRSWPITIICGPAAWLLTGRGPLHLDTPQAVPEFDLRGLQLRERRRQMLDFLVQLLLDLRELLGAEAVEAHWERTGGQRRVFILWIIGHWF